MLFQVVVAVALLCFGQGDASYECSSTVQNYYSILPAPTIPDGFTEKEYLVVKSADYFEGQVCIYVKLSYCEETKYLTCIITTYTYTECGNVYKDISTLELYWFEDYRCYYNDVNYYYIYPIGDWNTLVLYYCDPNACGCGCYEAAYVLVEVSSYYHPCSQTNLLLGNTFFYTFGWPDQYTAYSVCFPPTEYYSLLNLVLETTSTLDVELEVKRSVDYNPYSFDKFFTYYPWYVFKGQDNIVAVDVCGCS